MKKEKYIVERAVLAGCMTLLGVFAHLAFNIRVDFVILYLVSTIYANSLK